MSAKNKAKQDSANAHRMKLEGITRHHQQCVVCNKLVSLNSYQHHIASHR